jgi:hypothetical protein
MAINPSVKSYAELDISDDYQIRIEHVHDKKYDLHELVIKRKVLDTKTKEDTKLLPDINFNLDTAMFLQFCKFFQNIGEVRYGIK